MATNKLNARSPYFIQATGTPVVDPGQEEEEEIPLSIKIVQINADNTQTESPGVGESEENITLRAIANFTPANNVYTWTANSGTSLGTSVDATFTETLVDPITQQQYEYTVSAVTSDGETITSEIFRVNWVKELTQYRAELEVINDILPSFSSAGYDLSITMNATNQNAITHSTADGTLGKTAELTRAVTGINGDTYSFTLALTLKDGFSDDPDLAISTATHTGTFGTSNVSLTSTLTGTLVRDAVYILSADTAVITEGCPFTVSLSTTNLPNGSSVPFTITGVSAADLVRGNLSGAFLVQNNFAQIQFEAVSDAINELPNETFTLSLTGIPNTNPNVSQISVDIYDNITTGTPNEILVSTTGRDNPDEACQDTATETAFYRLLPGQDSFGNGIFLFSNQAMTIPYTSDGKYYRIGTGTPKFNGRIGAVCSGKLTEYVQCQAEGQGGEGTTAGTGIIVENDDTSATAIPNEGRISSNNEDIPGPNGEVPCGFDADVTVYYRGTINAGAETTIGGPILYTQKDDDNNLTNPFGGTDNWHKLVLFDSNSDPVNLYAFIKINPPGQVVSAVLCDTQRLPETTITTAPAVSINASHNEGSNTGQAFKLQRVELTAVARNATNVTYQWQKGTVEGSLSDISGETSQTMIINEIGGGGETQTTTGTVYYNCKISGDDINDTAFTNVTAPSDKEIEWGTRPSFTLKYLSASEPTDQVCTAGVSGTYYTDRNGRIGGQLVFCASAVIYTDEAGNNFAPAGVYSDTTNGTDGDYKYLTSRGQVPQSCIPYGCAGEPAQQPTTNIQKVAAQKCPGQPQAGRIEYFIFDNFSYSGLPTVLRIKDKSEFIGGCYTILSEYPQAEDLIGAVTLTLDDLERQQPFGSCDECVGSSQPEEDPVVINPNLYYGAYRGCGSTSGALEYIVHTSSLPNVIASTSSGQTLTSTCKHLVFSLHNNQGDIAAYSPNALVLGNLNRNTFNNCEACIGDGTPPDVSGFVSKYRYEKCDDSQTTITVGSPRILSGSDFEQLYPVVVFNGVCYEAASPTSGTTNINIDDLPIYIDCDTCDLAINPPAPPEPDPELQVKSMRISSGFRSDDADACEEISSFPNVIYYTGDFVDGTYVYTDETLSTVYSTIYSNMFQKTETGIVFSVGRGGGYGDPVAEGVLYDVLVC